MNNLLQGAKRHLDELTLNKERNPEKFLLVEISDERK